MTAPIVQSPIGITLLGGGDAADADLAAALALAPDLVAADGGADRALAAGLMPRAVIGDLDSISAAGRQAIPAGRLHLVAEQETTDFAKCLARVAAPLLVAVGFSGPRADHALAAWNALALWPGQRCIILGGADLGFLAPPAIALPLAAETRLSLFPLGPARGRSDGLRWPIGGLDFAPAGRIGTSNAALGPVRLEIDGPMLVILPRELLSLAAAALLAAGR